MKIVGIFDVFNGLVGYIDLVAFIDCLHLLRLKRAVEMHV